MAPFVNIPFEGSYYILSSYFNKLFPSEDFFYFLIYMSYSVVQLKVSPMSEMNNITYILPELIITKPGVALTVLQTPRAIRLVMIYPICRLRPLDAVLSTTQWGGSLQWIYLQNSSVTLTLKQWTYNNENFKKYSPNSTF